MVAKSFQEPCKETCKKLESSRRHPGRQASRRWTLVQYQGLGLRLPWGVESGGASRKGQGPGPSPACGAPPCLKQRCMLSSCCLKMCWLCLALWLCPMRRRRPGSRECGTARRGRAGLGTGRHAFRTREPRDRRDP
jgi:hypothetical protein